jgi:hypothetical protein
MFVPVIFSAGTTPATTDARSVSQAEYVRVVAESPPSTFTRSTPSRICGQSQARPQTGIEPIDPDHQIAALTKPSGRFTIAR